MTPSPSVLVIGAGGHAKVLLAALGRLGRTVAGFVDAKGQGTGPGGLPVLGDDDWLLAQGPERFVLVNAIGSTGSTALRGRVFQRFKAAGFQFLTVADPQALVEPDCRMGEGAQILKGAMVQPGVEIGANAIVNTGAIIDHDCRIGANAHIAPGCVLSGGVEIGDGSHLGTGSVVREGISIGQNAIIGAGSVVVSPVAAGALAYGNPARVVKP